MLALLITFLASFSSQKQGDLNLLVAEFEVSANILVMALPLYWDAEVGVPDLSPLEPSSLCDSHFAGYLHGCVKGVENRIINGSKCSVWGSKASLEACKLECQPLNQALLLEYMWSELGLKALCAHLILRWEIDHDMALAGREIRRLALRVTNTTDQPRRRAPYCVS
ncbi:hypothetical protein VNO77_37536 [Canavalia gladiata]|uniref:Uncharacterized protein n=1 Tax=Canavalia gladiata TaxID=3824 RepID=A0AAN9PX65_CANGL